MGTENDLIIHHKLQIKSDDLESARGASERFVRSLLLLGFILVLITEGWLLIQALDVFF
jgi:hypothetical protein